MQARRLEGRVALVTGAASGLGYACSAAVCRRGRGSDRRRPKRVSEWDGLCAPPPRRIFSSSTSVIGRHRIRGGGDLREHGRLDVLVTAAGSPAAARSTRCRLKTGIGCRA